MTPVRTDPGDVNGGYSPASDFGGWKWTTGAVHPFYGIPDAEGGIYKMPPISFDDWLLDPAFSERLKSDPVFGQTVPPGCEGLFHATNGHTVAAVAWKKRRILAQMIPERTLPAGGAGGSGVAGANPIASLQQKFEAAEAGEIEVFDMQEKRNDWPQSRNTQRCLHGDIREVAYVYVWRSWQEIVNDGDLIREPEPND